MARKLSEESQATTRMREDSGSPGGGSTLQGISGRRFGARSVLVLLLLAALGLAAFAVPLHYAIDTGEGQLGHWTTGLSFVVAIVLQAAAVGWLSWQVRQARHSARLVAAEQDVVRYSEERFAALVGNASDVVVILDPGGTIRYESPAAERIWEYPREALRGRNVFDLVHPDDLSHARNLLVQALESPRLNLAAELRLLHADGSWRTFEATVINLLRNPAVSGIVATFRDITERKAFEAQLAHQAFHDALTGLPNRALLMDRLEHAMARAARRRTMMAVLFLDLDNFKVVNDSLGHEAGDRLLVAVAERLDMCVRHEDTVARLGGDEFAVLLEDVKGIDDVRSFVERIQERLHARFTLGGRDVFITVSVGMALSDGGHERPDNLLREADAAMYQAKSNGRGCHEAFAPHMNTRAIDRVALETDLRWAAERGEFRAYYQPIVDLTTGQVRRVEALIRWQHPGRGLILPGEFIPVAEGAGVIVPIGRWILREACRQVRQWQARYPALQPLGLSVNLSARQFRHLTLAEDVASIVHDAGLNPADLDLEITESAMMQDVQVTVDTLRKLKEIGVSLSIDDFGTGYSSLAYLKRFSITNLKIDRSFVDGLGQDPEDTAIVRTIVMLAKTLNLGLTAEGIETIRQLAALRALGCNCGQGRYFAGPLPGDEMDALLSVSAGAGCLPGPNRCAT